MAQTKKREEITAEEETQAEIAEVQEEQPETNLTADVAAAAEQPKLDKAGKKEPKAIKSEEAEADTATDTTAEPVGLAKAGKRSSKAVREAEAEEVRQEAKEHRAEAEELGADAPKPSKRSLPNPLHAHGKKYREAAKLINPETAYSLTEALDLAKKTATTKFDSTVELHINLGVDPRQADQMVRSSVVLPHGSGKTIRIAVFADGQAAKDAQAAGADRTGTTDLLADIEAGKLDFDLLIAAPANMAALGKVAKVLGPRGLMPNPKSGTVAADVAAAVRDSKGGKVEFRIDKQAIIHQAIGRVSFSPEQLNDNATALIKAILQAKPSAAKGTYVRAAAVTTSMGPSIKIDAPATISAVSTGKR